MTHSLPSVRFSRTATVSLDFDIVNSKAPPHFVRKGRLSRETDTLDVVIPKLREFLEPVLAAAAENQELDAIWKPGGPWRSSREK